MLKKQKEEKENKQHGSQINYEQQITSSTGAQLPN
jgi:hypothetical protein